MLNEKEEDTDSPVGCRIPFSDGRDYAFRCAGAEDRAVERRADRNFIRQKFDKAMAQYETAIRREKDEAGQAALHLKTARLYFMVREYGRASEHYDKAMSLRPDLLGVDDVCDYVDALRFQGQARKAEAICLIMPIKTYIAAISAIRIHWRHLPCAIRFRKIPGFRQNAYY